MALPDFLIDGPEDAARTIVLAHGAGAPMDSPFMAYFAQGLAEAGHRCVRFEFPYMARRRAEGTKRPPDRAPVLADCWRDVVRHFGAPGLVIGGKSMGGRIASLICEETGVGALLCLGYPFYGAGRADKPRIEHLRFLKTRTLICQGERDAMGNRETVEKLPLSPAISYAWLPDGDHSFKPRKASGLTEEENLGTALTATLSFLDSL